ncbi:MAG TPA: hypothetical protein VMR33_05060 [Candidatus Baltobacteraceae bacterium]|nr:hypothetical protein [Candidatus Baltobacteraceae bacterium]
MLSVHAQLDYFEGDESAYWLLLLSLEDDAEATLSNSFNQAIAADAVAGCGMFGWIVRRRGIIVLGQR